MSESAPTTIAERYGTAVNAGSLEHSDGESHADRLGAMAFVRDRLATLLWRLKYGGDHTQLKPAHAVLVHRFVAERRMSRDIAGRVCARVILEWMEDRCKACKGRGMLGVSRQGDETGTARVCPSCQGTARRRVNQAARCEAIGVDRRRYRDWDGVFTLAERILQSAESAPWPVMAGQLERVRR